MCMNLFLGGVDGNKDSGIYKKISRLRKTLPTGKIRLLHVFKEDIFCNEIGKTVSSIVDGPVLCQKLNVYYQLYRQYKRILNMLHGMLKKEEAIFL